jgi:hypothetical protein
MSWMSRHKSLVIILIILTGLLISSFLLAAISNGYLAPLFYSIVALWAITVLGSFLYLARKSIRAFLSVLGLNLIGAPIAIFMASHFSGPAGTAVFLFTMAFWSFITGFIARSARGMYWALHISAWFVGLGLTTIPLTYDYYSPSWYWIIFPIGVSIFLFAQYKTILDNLSRNPFFRDRQPQPQSPSHLQPSQPSYEQGYLPAQPTVKAAYEEGGKLYPYGGQTTGEQAKAQYPQGMIQS